MVSIVGILAVVPLLPYTAGVRIDEAYVAEGQTQDESIELANLEDEGFPCRRYEICKCESAGYEEATTCAANTCTFTPWAPRFCSPTGKGWAFSPDCPKIKSWKSCMWANFNDPKQDYDAPGQDHYVEVPEAPAPTGEPLAVLTDVDDTIKCSGGGVGGVDKQCLGTKPHKMYPGVADFQLALARGVNNSMEPRKVIPLSARPSELRWILKMKENSPENEAYKKAASKAGIASWGIDTVRAGYGSVADFIDVLFKVKLTRFSRMGHRKFRNWRKIIPHVGGPTAFVGDNGQGDAVAAQMMLKESPMRTSLGGSMQVSFIHDVKQSCRSAECRTAWAKVGIHMFDHYPQAAEIAFRLGFISEESCSQVSATAPSLACNCTKAETSA